MSADFLFRRCDWSRALVCLLAWAITIFPIVCFGQADDSRRKDRFATAPGQGLKAKQVLGLANHIEDKGMQLDPLSGNWSTKHVVRDFLLLTDGSVRIGWPKELPLEDFDAAASKQAEPKLWGKFTTTKKTNGESEYKITWRDGKQENLQLSFVVLAQEGERIDGLFYRANTNQSGTGTGAVVSSHGWKSILFKPDGHFDTSSGGGSELANTRGNVTAGNSKSTHGTYRASGSLLELKFEDGSAERLQFAFSSEKKDWIYVNGLRLLKRK